MKTKLLQVAHALVEANAFRNTQRFLSTFRTVFKDTNLEGKAVLDIGCGPGGMTFGAAAMGARLAVGLEPEMEGSTLGFIKTGKQLAKNFGFNNVILKSCTLDAYDFAEGPFDVIVMYNVVNHLNEEACINIHKSNEARDCFKSYFSLLLSQLLSQLTQNGVLIAADCARNNFWGDIGVRNPVAKTIEWEKHQNPSVWANLLKSVGFQSVEYWWNPPYKIRFLGSIVKNKPVAYLTNSHFILKANK